MSESASREISSSLLRRLSLASDGSRPPLLQVDCSMGWNYFVRKGVSLEHANAVAAEFPVIENGGMFLLKEEGWMISWALGHLLSMPLVLQEIAENKIIKMNSERRSGWTEKYSSFEQLRAPELVNILKAMSREENPGLPENLADHHLLTNTPRLPFRDYQSTMSRISRLEQQGSLQQYQQEMWLPAGGSDAWMVSGIAGIDYVLVLRSLNQAALIRGNISRQYSFGSIQQLGIWLEEQACDGKLQLCLPSQAKVSLKVSQELGGVRNWEKTLSGFYGLEQAYQDERVEDAAKQYLDGQISAFSEEVNDRNLISTPTPESLSIAAYRPGGLVHTGHPAQSFRTQTDTPGSILFRPLNPFAASSNNDS